MFLNCWYYVAQSFDIGSNPVCSIRANFGLFPYILVNGKWLYQSNGTKSIECCRANVRNTKIIRKSGNQTGFDRMSNDRMSNDRRTYQIAAFGSGGWGCNLLGIHIILISLHDKNTLHFFDKSKLASNHNLTKRGPRIILLNFCYFTNNDKVLR